MRAGLLLTTLLIALQFSAIAAWSPAPNSPYAISAGSGGQLLATGDFDRDGYADVIVANTNIGTVTVLFGDGTGLFGRPQSFACGGSPLVVITGDLNMDGKPDIVVGNMQNPGSITILYGNGSGGVAFTRSYPAGVNPLGIVAADFNRDGKPDLAFTTPTQVVVWLGDGTGNLVLAPGAPFATRGAYPEFICSADLNNDGILDLAVTNFHGANTSVMFGDGSGRFAEINASPFACRAGTTGIAKADFNGDGKVDLAIANQNHNSVTVLRNNGGGSFSILGPIATNQTPVALITGDFDGDGKADIATGSLNGGDVGLLGGNGDGTFRAVALSPAGGRIPGIAAGQFNGGGLLDLAAADTQNSKVSVLLNNADLNGPGSFRFGSASYTATESGGVANVTILRVAGNMLPASITVNSQSSSAVSPGDFGSVSQTLNFASGEISKTIQISIHNDNRYEGSEFFDVVLSNPGGGATLSSPASARVNITDAQSPGVLTLDAPGYSVGEDDGALIVHVRLSVAAQAPTQVVIDAIAQTASNTSDYAFEPQTLTFNPGDTDIAVSIPISPDDVYEGNETFQLRLRNPTNSASLGSPSTASALINDAQSAGVLTLDAPSYSVDEGDGALIVHVRLSVAAQAQTQVVIETVDQTASNTSDYGFTPQTLNFNPGNTDIAVSIPISPDDVYEGDETFQVRLRNPTNSASLGSPFTANALITDAQSPAAVNLDAISYAVKESDSALLVTLTLSKSSQRPVSVDVSAIDGQARAGFDFTAPPPIATFAPTQTSLVVSIPIDQDNVFEGSETFKLQISNVTGGASLGTQTAAVATILDAQSPGEISFASALSEVPSAATTLALTVTLSQASENPISVDYRTSDDSAVSFVDFTPTRGTLTFASGETTHTLQIELLDNPNRRNDRRFIVELFNPTLGTSIEPIGVTAIVFKVAASVVEGASLVATVGEPCNLPLPASGSEPLTLTHSPLPPGLGISGLNFTGTPTDIGTYTITLEASNQWGSGSGAFTLVVVPRSQSSGSLTTLDSDGDGFPDEIERGFGTDPHSTSSAPSFSPIAQALAIDNAKLKIKLSFSKSSADSLTLTATLPDSGDIAGLFLVDIGGVVKTFTIDAQGIAKAADASVKIAAAKKSSAGASRRISLKVSKQALASQLRDEGLQDQNAKAKVANVPVIIYIGASAYAKTVQGKFTARAGKMGRFSGK